MLKPLLLHRTKGITGAFYAQHAHLTANVSKSGVVAGECIGRITTATITNDAPDEVEICFNGLIVGPTYGSRLDGWTYTLNGGAPQSFFALEPGDGINFPVTCQKYVLNAPANAGDIIVVYYDETPGSLEIDCGDGYNPLTSQNKIVVNNIVPTPQYVSGRVYDSGNNQIVEITFNQAISGSGWNGVTITADGNARAITAVSGFGTATLSYTTSLINSNHVVVWDYVEATGNLVSTSTGTPVPDINETVQNQLLAQTLWDTGINGNAVNDPFTFWDGSPPDETTWDKGAI